MRSVLVPLFCILSIVWTVGPVMAIERQVLQVLAEKLHNVGGSCPELVWPRFSLQDRQMVIVDDEKAWLLSADSLQSKPLLRELDPAELSDHPEFFMSLFAFGIVKQKNTMSIHYQPEDKQNNDYQETFGLAVHEGFHVFSQLEQGWPPEDSKASRASILPIESQPVYLRKMILRNLLLAFQKPEKRKIYLGRAAHWQNRYWQQKNSRARINRNDVSEGTAKYVEVMALALTHGCETKQKAVRTNLLPIIESKLNNIDEVSAQSYDLGLLAGILLREERTSTRKYRNWEERVMLGNSPTEVLLSAVTPRKEDDDSGTKAMVELAVNQQNESIEVTLGTFLDAYGSSEYLLFSAPQTKIQNPIISAMYEMPGKMEGIILQGSNMRLQTDLSLVDWRDTTVVAQDLNACGKHQIVIPYKKGDIYFKKNAKDTFEIVSSRLIGQMTGLASPQDSRFICIQ